MLDQETYLSLDAMGLAELISRRQVSARDVENAMWRRHDEVNPAINAVIGGACRQDKPRVPAVSGRFAGVPYLLKDLAAPAAGIPLTNGSRAFLGEPAGFDGETVARLRRAGLAILGRTNSPEFGMLPTTEPVLYGPTRNPWSPGHSAGGSSGGAAAAVAAGIVPAAHATDTMGSIRIPASCCGVFGLKPTRGLVPIGPHRGDANQGLSHEHCVSRTVRDSAALLDAVAGPDEGAPWFTEPEDSYLAALEAPPGKLRIAYLLTDGDGDPAHPECRAAVLAAARLCEEAGHHVGPASVRWDGARLARACCSIVFPSIATAVQAMEAAKERPLHRDEVEGLTWSVIAKWGRLGVPEFHRALADLNQIVRSLAGQLRDWDILLSPVMPDPPRKIGELASISFDADGYESILAYNTKFTLIANATGRPAASLPLHIGDQGLPIGVQALARFGQDAALLRLARQLEEHFVGRPGITVPF